MKQARSKVARRYDVNRKPHEYRVGDTVVLRLNTVGSKAHNISAKLSLRWSKPVVIAKIVWPNTVLLTNPETGVIVRRAHVNQLKPLCNDCTLFVYGSHSVMFCCDPLPLELGARQMIADPCYLEPEASVAEEGVPKRRSGR